MEDDYTGTVDEFMGGYLGSYESEIDNDVIDGIRRLNDEFSGDHRMLGEKLNDFIQEQADAPGLGVTIQDDVPMITYTWKF